jgi:hypothetical protein
MVSFCWKAVPSTLETSFLTSDFFLLVSLACRAFYAGMECCPSRPLQCSCVVYSGFLCRCSVHEESCYQTSTSSKAGHNSLTDIIENGVCTTISKRQQWLCSISVMSYASFIRQYHTSLDQLPRSAMLQRPILAPHPGITFQKTSL